MPVAPRHLALRAFVDVSTLGVGSFLFAFGIPAGKPLLWAPGAIISLVGIGRITAAVRTSVRDAKSPAALAARADEFARWDAVAPAPHPDTDFVIRIPSSRVRNVAIVVLALVFVLLALTSATVKPVALGSAALYSAMALMFLFLAWRLARVAVIGEPHRIIVRNTYATLTYARRDIARFDVQTPTGKALLLGAAQGPAIVLTTRSGQTTQLVATSADPRIKGGRDRLEPSLAMLRGWLNA